MAPDNSRPVPVAIIGMGCLFPKAESAPRYWSNVREGVDAITEVPLSHWRVEDYFDADPKAPDRTYARRGGFLSPVDFAPLDFGLAPNTLEATDATQLLGLVAARQAMIDAGYGPDREFDKSRVSVLLGVTGTLELVIPLAARLGHPLWRKALDEAGVSPDQADEVVRKIADGYVGWQEDSFPGLLGNVVAGRISNRLDLKGTNCVVDAACASSLGAVHLALLELASGRSDMVLTGGMDTFNDIFMYMCFSKTPALSPTGDARPFAADGDGTILGEGLGCLVLKRLDDAERDGDRIYAVIKAVGSSSDGKGHAIYAPSSEGQTRALNETYRLADVTPDTIELVEAHGTGTHAGDAAEAAALLEVYGSADRKGPWCAIGSVKSQIGHTKAAAGAAGLMKAALALHNKVLPPTIKVNRPIDSLLPGDSPFYVNTEKRPWLPSPDHPRRAAVSAFGFGGSNYHCVLEEYRPEKDEVDWDGDLQLIAFSDDTPEGLDRSLSAWPAGIGWDEVRRRAARSRAEFDTDQEYRLVLVAERRKGDLDRLIGEAKTVHRGRKSVATPDGVYYGVGPAQGDLALLFPGQGAQYPGMFRDLACRFPEMQRALADAEAAFAEDHEGDDPPLGLSDYIYPKPTFDRDAKRLDETALRATEVAQPALGAMALGMVTILDGFGIKPAAAAGHSYGELPSLCAAGRFSPQTLHRLSRLRGRSMAEGSGDRGAMLAVLAPRDTIETVLGEDGLSLVVANRNAPRQSVLSGASSEIARAREAFKRRQIEAVSLSVSAAFHSPFVAEAEQRFSAALEDVDLQDGAIPVFANTTGRVYPDDPGDARRLLAGQLAQPVEFVSLVENMYEAGFRTFLEVGPSQKLTGLVGAILKGKGHSAFSVDASNGSRDGLVDLARTLAQVAALGHEVKLVRWEDGPVAAEPRADKKPTLTIPICGANYVKPKSLAQPASPRKASATPATTDFVAKHTSTNGNGNGHAPGSSNGNGHTNGSHPAPVPAVAPNGNGAYTNGQGAYGNGSHPAPLAVAPSPRFEAPAPVVHQPAPAVAPMGTNPALLALQELGEQTARLHRQFLEGQDRALQVFQTLLGQPSHAPTAAPAAPVAAPQPVAIPQAVAPAPVAVPAPIVAPRPAPTPPAPVAVAPPPAPAPVAVPVAAPAPAPAQDGKVEAALLAVVSEKTGYPAEMLDLAMEIEADLGIDSIKRVEIFSALQDKLPDSPAIRAEHLGTLRTLRQVAEFLAGPSAAPAPVAPAPAAVPVADDRAVTTLLAVVSEKTGYPSEMLDLAMEIEADLGIDSIKRVEIFSALQDRLPDAPPIRAEHLGTLRTLQQVAEFLGGPTARIAPAPVAPAPVAVAAPAVDNQAAEILLAVVSEKTGYPAEMLDPSMELEADLGIDSIKRVEIFSALQDRLPDAPAIRAEHLGTLRTLRQVAEFLGGSPAARPAAPQPAPVAAPLATPTQSAISRYLVEPVALPDSRPAAPLATGGEVWILGDGTDLAPALAARLQTLGLRPRLVTESDVSPASELAGLVILAPRSGDAVLRSTLRLLQLAAPGLRRSGKAGGSTFVTVTRFDGNFGLNGLSPESDPALGGLAGFAKTAGHEWPEVRCRAIDLDPALTDLDEAARLIADEMLRSGPSEVGISASGRVGLELRKSNLEGAGTVRPLERGDVVVVTGGARGVTAEVAVSLARSFAPTLVLLGRSPAPEAEPAWLASLKDEAEIKRAILGRKAGTSPREIEAEYRRIAANREALRNLARVADAGARPIYRQVDVRDDAAVRSTLETVAREFGPIRGLVHGAGVLADSHIEAKTVESFDMVYGTKVDGLRSLLASIPEDGLKALVLFSSSTARFGRTGQVDYAVANEVLNKTAEVESRRRPNCRVVSVNWGPWDGGMVTTALKGLFASEGVGLIPTDAGADYLVRELSEAASRPVEVVILGGEGLPTPPAPAPTKPAFSALSTVFERELTFESVPVLRSHVIDGRGVLPMAITLEWLAHAAMHGNPGLSFHGVEGLRILRGVFVDEGRPYSVRVLAGKATRRDGMFVVPTELVGEGEVVHARAEVVLANALPKGPAPALRGETQPYCRTLNEVYGDVLFHGADLHGIVRVEGCSDLGIAAAVSTAPPPADWMSQPARGSWLADPLAVDSVFQLMILWSTERHGAPSLPCFLGRYRQYRRAFPKDGLRVVARVTKDAEHLAQSDVEIVDASGEVVATLVGYECVIDASLGAAFRRNGSAR